MMNLPRFAAVDTSEELLRQALSLANSAADEAAAISLSYFRQDIAVENKASAGLFDPVTQADKKIEQLIREKVADRFPAHGFYGEEGDNAMQRDTHIWVVDPIDGTRAFITGMPAWGTLLALFDGQDVVLGLLDQPFLGERYVGVAGESYLVNHKGKQALSTRGTTLVESAVLHCTTPEMFSDPKQLAQFNKLTNEVAMTRYGGDCYSYALLAMGLVDAVIESDLKPYDIQALIPIVTGAGGVVSDWHGGSAVAGGAVVASANADLHERLLSRLQA